MVLVLASLVIALLGLFMDRLDKKQKKPALFLAVALLCLLAASQLIVNNQEARAGANNSVSGTLRSRAVSSSPKALLMLCDIRVAIRADASQPAMTFIEDPVFIRMQDGEAKISLLIRDEKGLVRATIRDNVWFVPRSEGVLDRNFNEDTLEVIGTRGEILLQVKVEADKVRLFMASYSPQGGGRSTWGNLLTQCSGGNGPLFKYPSSEFLGELAL